MIRYLEADLLDFPEDITVIAHSCNCQNTMGKGIAKQIKDRYPEAYKADTKAHKLGQAQLGNFSYALVTRPPALAYYVYNLYTQQHYGTGRRVSYDAFHDAMQKFSNEIKELQEASGRKVVVGLPYKISCNNAGGSWSIIEPIIDLFFNQQEVDAVIVVNKKYDNE